MNVVIGISWPFANGDLHIGHAASSLPGDVIARYHRLKGNNVLMVSGTDSHGTPIEVKALKENRNPKDIVSECHEAFTKDWKDLGMSFDLFNRTDDDYHKEFVQEQFKKYYEYGYLFEKEEEQLYCENCNMFLADRYILGTCPKCGADIKGDECEKCGSLLTIDEVKDTKCAICGKPTTKKVNKNLYFKLSEFEDEIRKMCEEHKSLWRDNAVKFTERYLNEGIPDRCISRVQKYGIDIPVKGYEDKKLYGWFENVWGYVTAAKKIAEEKGLDWNDYWKKDRDNKVYLVHAKDNIPFHTVIFPILLLATKDGYKMPDKIVSDEYVNIEGEKLSKSKGNYIPIRHLLDRYSVDTTRYFLTSNDPENKDFNFTWEGYINSHNGELLGKWGNFVNRTLQFINKSFDGKLSNTEVDTDIETKLKELYDKVGTNIDNGDIKLGIENIFEFIAFSNKYFDENEPWNLAKTDKDACEKVLYNCCNIIFNINNLLKPYLIESTVKVEKYLNSNINEWEYVKLDKVDLSKEIDALFLRYDKSLIDEEKSLLGK
ncbi:MAG: methionine--tRNA ligase [Bacilli bacterium]|nr:methionine--tRNA ligase [Bacilli bacterium]